jgi:hypothetical protein
VRKEGEKGSQCLKGVGPSQAKGRKEVSQTQRKRGKKMALFRATRIVIGTG